MALLVAGGYALMETEKGRHYVGVFIAFVLEKQTGYEFEIYGMEVQIRELKISADKLIIKDKNGEWLSAQDMKLDWDYENLVGIDCAIKSIESRSITISALPEDSFKTLNNLQEAMFTSVLSTDELSVPLITFKQRVLGDKELKVRLNGSCDAVGRSRHYVVEGLSEVLSLDLTLQDVRGLEEEMGSRGSNAKGEEAPKIQAYAKFSENSGGVLAGFLGLPESDPLYIEAFVPIYYLSIKNAIVKFNSSQIDISSFIDADGYFYFTGNLTANDDVQVGGFTVPANKYKFDIEFRPNPNWSQLGSMSTYIASEDRTEELFVSGDIALWNSQYNLIFLANLPISSALWQGKTTGLKSNGRALLSGSVKGVFRNPTVQLNLDSNNIEHVSYKAKRAKVSVSIHNLLQASAGVSVTGSLSLSGLSMFVGEATSAVNLPDLDASIKVKHSINRNDIWKVESLYVGMGQNKKNAKGAYYSKNRYIEMKHTLEINQLPDYLVDKYRLPGSITAKGNMSGTWDDRQLKEEVKLSGREMESMPVFIGPMPSLNLTLFYNEAAGYISFIVDNFFSDGLAGTVSARVGLNTGLITGDGKFWALKSPMVKSASLEQLEGIFNFEGSINDMTLSSRAGGVGVSSEGETVNELRFKLYARGPLDELNGNLRTIYEQNGAAITSSSPVELGVLYFHLKEPDRIPSLKYRKLETVEVNK